MESLEAQVNSILTQRRNLLPAVQRELDEAASREANLRQLASLLSQLRETEKDEAALHRINNAIDSLDALLDGFAARRDSLNSLRVRFSRDTVNIGVSGEARVGKSTTLQKFSGLTDTQIPTGKGLPVTAVRSEIFNSTEDYAEVAFRDQRTFIAEYIQPLLEIVNNHLFDPIAIDSISGLRNAKFPDTLGTNVGSVSTDSLSRLLDAQRSLGTYEDLLTGGIKRVSLNDLRNYVAYPTKDDLDREKLISAPVNRAYVAVKSVKIYCTFPRLAGVKIGLVDLPGLGEIDASVADMHLQGLEDGVDLIFPIMRPTDAEGYAKQGIASNIDHLRRIQPGIKKRGDLITAGINVTQGLDETVKSLRDDFERKINSANSDPIGIIEYDAIDDASVSHLFDELLQRIAERLPSMDQEVFAHALASSAGEVDVRNTLAELNSTLTQLLRLIPIPEKILHQQIAKIASDLIHGYNGFQRSQAIQAGEHSDWYIAFDNDVERIYLETTARINDGFFLGQARWEETARGHKDYYNWYRDEAQRLRREIIAQYSGLDVFYDDQVTQFKSDIIDIFFDNTGQLRIKFQIAGNEEPDAVIEKLATEFAGTIQDEDLDSALRLLKDVRFSFRNNVFLQISNHLEELANPPERFQVGFGKHPEFENIREELGVVGNFDQQIAKLKLYLHRITQTANEDIRSSLLQHDDRFHEYLSVSVSFFNDFLYRKDEDNFKHLVIRSLIREYRDFVLGEDSGVSIDGKKKDLIDQIKVLIEEVNGEPIERLTTTASSATRKSITSTRPAVSPRHNIAANETSAGVPITEPRQQFEAAPPDKSAAHVIPKGFVAVEHNNVEKVSPLPRQDGNITFGSVRQSRRQSR